MISKTYPIQEMNHSIAVSDKEQETLDLNKETRGRWNLSWNPKSLKKDQGIDEIKTENPRFRWKKIEKREKLRGNLDVFDI